MKKTILSAALAATAMSTVCVSSLVSAESSNDTSFNPKISVILDGVYYSDNKDGEGIEHIEEMSGILGSHGHGEDEHGHGELERGFNIREAEVTLSGTVDPHFDAWMTVAFSDGETEIEEAYFETRALPLGWKIKAGKFLSGIGYHNEQHLHSWSFSDQTLAHQTFFGDHGLADSGLQVTYLPATPIYTLVGVELFQGDQDKFGALVDHEDLEEDAGPRLSTIFAKIAPEISSGSELQLGVSVVRNGQHQEDHSEDPDVEVLEGDVLLWGLDAVFKKLPTGSYGEGGLTLQAEYFNVKKDLTIEVASDADELGEEVTGKQDAFYLQAVYGIAPRWSIGARYEKVGFVNELEEESKDELGDSRRLSLAATWQPTEYSKFRLQFARADISEFDEDAGAATSETFNQIYLQYNVSLGAHGAHQF